jgi:flagellar biogenesis protein FliO
VLRVYLAIVVLGVVAILARRFVKKTSAVNGVAVTARTTLARGVAVAVVEVDHRRFLVSISGSATVLLAELDHAPEVGEAVPTAAVVTPATRSVSFEPARTDSTRTELPLAVPALSVPAIPVAHSFLDRARRATSRSLQPTGR